MIIDGIEPDRDAAGALEQFRRPRAGGGPSGFAMKDTAFPPPRERRAGWSLVFRVSR
jgi:hypothetical protein